MSKDDVGAACPQLKSRQSGSQLGLGGATLSSPLKLSKEREK